MHFGDVHMYPARQIMNFILEQIETEERKQASKLLLNYDPVNNVPVGRVDTGDLNDWTMLKEMVKVQKYFRVYIFGLDSSKMPFIRLSLTPFYMYTYNNSLLQLINEVMKITRMKKSVSKTEYPAIGRILIKAPPSWLWFCSFHVLGGLDIDEIDCLEDSFDFIVLVTSPD